MMKRNSIVLSACALALLCVVGFQSKPTSTEEWQYKVIETRATTSQLQTALDLQINKGWELESTMVCPADANYTTTRFFIVLKKQK